MQKFTGNNIEVIFDINAGFEINEIMTRYNLIQIPGDYHVGYSLSDLPERLLVNFKGNLITIPAGTYTNVGIQNIDGENVYMFHSTDGNALMWACSEKELTRLVGSWGVDIISMIDKNNKIIEVDNPLSKLFSLIDSAKDKNSIYKSIITRLVQDKNISIKDKQSILILDE